MRIRGQWPNPISLRQGWARAVARPWNRTRPDAHLRLDRGSSRFLAAATSTVLGLGASAVVSPPLLVGSQRVWRQAGFEPYVQLSLLRSDLNGEMSGDDLVQPLDDSRWLEVVDLDGHAFGGEWRAELPALVEALESSPSSALLGITETTNERLAGYVIVAATSGTGYLQRLAVHPAAQGQGFGRALARAAHNWARRRGARYMILNTKPSNQAALSLYHSEGYVAMPDRLQLLRYGAA